MNKSMSVIGMLLAILLLAACGAAVGEEPAAPQEAAENGNAAVVERSDAAVLAPIEDESAQAEANMNEGSERETARPEAEVSQPVEPVAVELSQVTAEAVGGEPREMPAPGVPDPLVALTQKVRLDLADQLSVDVEAVDVVSTRSVDWRDSSLGCPEPGQMYMTVITPGYEITLETGGKRFIYHTDRSERFVTCDNPEPGLSPTSPDS